MKQFIFFEILNRLRTTPDFKRKLKIFAIIGAIGFVVTSALLIWAGVSAVRFASNEIQRVNIQEHAESLENRLEDLPVISVVSCWDKAQSLLNLESWTTRPAADNFKNLKTACLKAQPPLCEGEACQDFKMKMDTKESEKII